MGDRLLKKLYVVGIGAGNYEGMTVGAVRALGRVDLIVGYTVYCDLLKPYFPDKEFLSTPMMHEMERCRMALEHAADGKVCAMVSSGDAGIYGMAAPVLALAPAYGVEVEVIVGVTAASSGAALLGAPLTADFAVISLSDLLMPYEVIERRLCAAAQGDFCIVLYNPSSRKRADYLQRACEIVLRTRAPETICGIAQNIGRAGESFRVLSLAELAKTPVDMFTTVFIGNSTTACIGGKMVTPRSPV
ncbi:MAG: precorrin-3B C(17)-methyltransferase [Clostridia bacterium]|nr:precorrin-3B C(17)-methyltransferase [Clostridia bacterium]